MALTAGALSIVSVGPNSATLSSAAATMGTSPYTYQWYKSTSSGFSPGSGNIISGATSLTLNDTGLVPGVTVYYKVVVTDAASTTATSSQLTVAVPGYSQNQNQFAMSPVLGMTDERFNANTIPVKFDPAGSGTLVAGQAVIFSTNASPGGVPLVVQSTATSDNVAGFVNYSIKDALFNPGDRLDISIRGNVIYLIAGAAMNRGTEVTSLPAGVAGGGNGVVIAAVGSGGLPKVGWCFDQPSVGALFRVYLTTPAFILS